MPLSEEERDMHQRRKLLGPESDILHPEFQLRPTRPDEVFVLRYDYEVSVVPDVDAQGNPIKRAADHMHIPFHTKFFETIFRRDGTVVDLDDVPPVPTVDLHDYDQ